jgi:hypothetical protein
MTYHSSGADRFRDVTGGDIYRTRLPILSHSGEQRWNRLRMLARRIVSLLAAQRVAVAASRTRRLQCQQSLCGSSYDRAPAARTANRRRP